jgi:predicted transcriptional regulator
MGVRDRHKVANALCSKGFINTEKDHHRFIYYTLTGIKTAVFTKISRGASHKGISKGILAQMAKQCRLSNAEFRDLLDCPLSREGYENLLKAKGAIRFK